MSENQETKETQVAEDSQNTATSAPASTEERKDRRSGGRSNRRSERRSRKDRDDNRDELLDRVVTINRVAKTHKGGRTFSFAALVVVGDGKGTVGVGYGKSREVPAAIAKGQLDAKKHMFTVPRIQKLYATRSTVTMRGTCSRPAALGTCVIAGGPVRAVLECAGITDILSKSMGSSNALNIVIATVAALKQLEEPEEVAVRRGLTLEEVAPASLLRARAEGLADEKKAREEAQAKAAQKKDGE